MGTIALLALPGQVVLAAMSSANYEIKWDAVTPGGEDTSVSASYRLRDSVGETAGGSNSSTTYQNGAGYRQGVFDQVATFKVMIQYRNSQVAATAFSGNTVTVGSTTGFSVDDYIAVVENDGDGQDSAIGKVISIVGNDLTVDFFTDSGSTPTIDGSNDYVYNLNASSLSFGSLTANHVETGIIAWEVDADVSEGYHVYVYQDHDLRKTTDISEVIDGVSDGDVSAGVEYGARSSDSSLALSTFDTQDTAFDEDFQEVGSRSDNSFMSRDYLTASVVRNNSVDDGTYNHTLTLLYVGDY
jgi:hypothetical protein